MSPPDLDDPDDLKKAIKDIQDAIPFAISSMTLMADNTLLDRCLDWGQIDPHNPDHSDFTMLKAMLNMQIPELCDITHEVFYEDFRLRMLDKGMSSLKCGSPVGLRTTQPSK
jgi:septin family protein